ncbi:MAG: hypothetical protein GEU26_15355 [Nitrososphaeraceae archaeon]|nr:hypothetical protein [Nitrososphaeraceae archaeon]
MGSKTWVCALCSQDFTRKYSAYRHSRDLHRGTGKIVRMIDYVIGRIAGEYNPGNPLTHRSKYMKHDSTFPHSDAKGFNFPSASIAHDSSRGVSSNTLPHNEVHVSDQQPNTNPVQSSTYSICGFTSKFDDIQKLARALLPPQTTEALLRGFSLAVIDNGGNEDILDRGLKVLRNSMNVTEASRYLFGAPAQEANRPPLHGHQVEHLPESSRTKLAEIEKILKMILKNDVAVWKEIKRLIDVCNSTRYHTILDLELDSLRRNSSNK